MSELETAQQIADRVFDLNLIDERQLQEVWGALGHHEISVDEFTQQLLRRDLLTNFQLDRLMRGERGGFFYGPYKVLYLVNAGSFARVYRAVDKRSGKVVALKVLRRRYSEDKNFTEQFRREGEMGKTLRHPNIVSILDVLSQGTNHFFVMEFVEGGNLRDLLRIRKKVPPVQSLTLLADALAGLHYAFQKGICHRDLKLTNVLVSAAGQARLIDFGLAGIEDQDADEANPRTIDYAGLERSSGVRKDDLRSDIFFCGAILYHLLCGIAPLHETRDRVQRLSKQRYIDVIPLRKHDPSLPRVVAAVVKKAMEFDAEKRYQTPAQMLVDVKLALTRLQSGQDDPAPAEDLTAAGDELSPEDLASQAERDRLALELLPQADRRPVMIVESSVRMQDILRDGLKSCGYRVLVIGDPQRALDRFQDDEYPADCVVFSAGHLKSQATTAFQTFTTAVATTGVPAVLLLGDKQAWTCPTPLATHQVVGKFSKLRELRSLLDKLCPASAPRTKRGNHR